MMEVTKSMDLISPREEDHNVRNQEQSQGIDIIGRRHDPRLSIQWLEHIQQDFLLKELLFHSFHVKL